MLWLILLILSVLWMVGIITSNTLGGFLHILLIIAFVIMIIRIIQERDQSDKFLL